MGGMAADRDLPGLDFRAVRDWLSERLPEAGEVVDAELITGGRSNLTYRLAARDRALVLRRPPLGHVLPTAHDMAREFRVLSALYPSAVPVPRPLVACTDETVNGAPFYVMEHIDGAVLRSAEDGERLTAAQAAELSERFVRTLAAIHDVDVDAVGLGDFGRPEGYLARQLRRWQRQWEGSSSREVAGYRELVARLTHELPETTRTALVHGDFRLDNALVAIGPRPRIAAVVDWEMSTLGDPLADLGLTLTYWTEAGDEEAWQRSPIAATVTASPGFFTRAQFARRYAELTGVDVGEVAYYMAFGHFKLAVVTEGIHARYLKHATVGDGFESVGEAVPRLVERAHRILDERTS